ncbi:MAG: response regulator [Bacteroidota bacterium]|nr:response regulator [Bacteroidota bacterium]
MKHNTILLVEDDYLDVESVKRALKKLDIAHTLHIAHNGVDALNMLTDTLPDGSRLIPDVILLDINMPKMSGIEFLGIIKNYSSLKNIKIFIITTSSEDYDKAATQNLGITGYILKPLNFKDKASSDTLKLLSELLSADD